MKKFGKSASRKYPILLLTILLLTGSAPFFGSAQSPESEKKPSGRKLDNKTSREVPVVIHAVRNLQKPDDEWFRDLEIEVKNVSDKPIYFISLGIEFPKIDPPPPAPRDDGIVPSRTVVGFGLRFGNPRLGVLRNLAGPEDESLKPGETYTFKIAEGVWKGLESIKKKKNLSPDATSHIELFIDTVGFGDGTGYVAGRKIDKKIKAPKEKSSYGGNAPSAVFTKASWSSAAPVVSPF